MVLTEINQEEIPSGYVYNKGRTKLIQERYSHSGRYITNTKIQVPVTDRDFTKLMQTGKFVAEEHKGFVALLYYSAVRKTEALRVKKEQFRVDAEYLNFDVGKRLKHGSITPNLPIPLELPYVDSIVKAIDRTGQGEEVFPYSDRTGYNIVNRVYAYPHFFRLSRITNFFIQGWTIADIRSWTGLTLTALNYYVGLVSVKKMGAKLS